MVNVVCTQMVIDSVNVAKKLIRFTVLAHRTVFYGSPGITLLHKSLISYYHLLLIITTIYL